MVRAGAQVNDRDAKERTALIWAVRDIGSPFEVRNTVLAGLVENNADVNAAACIWHNRSVKTTGLRSLTGYDQ